MSKTEKMTVTAPADLIQQIKQRAKKEDRNFSNMVTLLLKQGMRKEKAA